MLRNAPRKHSPRKQTPHRRVYKSQKHTTKTHYTIQYTYEIHSPKPFTTIADLCTTSCAPPSYKDHPVHISLFPCHNLPFSSLALSSVAPPVAAHIPSSPSHDDLAAAADIPSTYDLVDVAAAVAPDSHADLRLARTSLLEDSDHRHPCCFDGRVERVCARRTMWVVMLRGIGFERRRGGDAVEVGYGRKRGKVG